MSQTLQQTCVVLAQLNAKPTLKFLFKEIYKHIQSKYLVKVAISQELFSFEYHCACRYRWGKNGDLVHGLLNRWTSQLDLGSTTGGLERVVSVHNST